jgi:uncharacterized RDD family membrane protein YckC
MKLPALRSTGRVLAEPLAVAPALVGQPLGTPLRRALALGIDLWLVSLLSVASLWWLALGIAALGGVLRWAMREEGIERRWADALAAAMLLLALAVAWQAWRGPHREASERARAVQPATASALGEGQRSDAERIAELEAALAAARSGALAHTTDLSGWRERLTGLLDEIGLGLGWSIVYFSLLPAFWHGQTVGKKLLKLRIVELSGQPLNPLRGLKRYGGYVAGMATGGLGFAQVLWEPNRQALHDKAAHTVVLDLRPSPAASPAVTDATPPEEPPACTPPSTNA